MIWVENFVRVWVLQVPTAQGCSRGLEHLQGWRPHKFSVSIPGFLSQRSLKKSQVVPSTEGIHPQQQILGCGSSHNTPAPLSSTPKGCKSTVLDQIHKSWHSCAFILTFPCPWEPGSAFPTQIKPRADKFSCLCLPQISCPPFPSSPWPSPQRTDAAVPLFLSF